VLPVPVLLPPHPPVLPVFESDLERVLVSDDDLPDRDEPSPVESEELS